MADQDAHFRVMDEALKHPDGRAKGGEPCVICGKPVLASAHWVQRDRHVCSGRCNNLLRRRYGRGSASINAERVAAAVEATGPRPNPRTSGPRIFHTRAGARAPELPIEWEGYGPYPGDVVERYGVLTRYLVQDMPDGYFTSRIVVECHAQRRPGGMNQPDDQRPAHPARRDVLSTVAEARSGPNTAEASAPTARDSVCHTAGVWSEVRQKALLM